MFNPFIILTVKQYALSLKEKGRGKDEIILNCRNKFKNLAGNLKDWEEGYESLFDKNNDNKREDKNSHNLSQSLNAPVTPKSSHEEKGDITICHHSEIASLVKQGNHILITGKAGTGKTTLLKEIYNSIKGKGQTAILAPTGIAAKNAGGVTIHSFFKFKIGPWLPTSKKVEHNLNPTDMAMLREVKTIIIDEISMVRCDLLDQIDALLRAVTGKKTPFGEKQIIMFGDLFQLMPVETEEDKEHLQRCYKTPYFFGSKVFERMNLSVINLTKVYRQSNSNFINILNNIRRGKPTIDDLCRLNTRFIPNCEKENPSNILRLTTHNIKSKLYNNGKLKELKGEEKTYKASIQSIPYGHQAYLDKKNFPTDFYLKLKKGARVMFVKNDNSAGQYVNGTLGVVEELYENMVRVRTEKGKSIFVSVDSWEFDRYRYDRVNKRIIREPYAKFVQLPLRLAWCVTIHKSQGLTFDKLYLDLAKTFTFGQVYVALSRCRTLEGIHLVKRIIPENVMTDPKVVEFYKKIGIEDY